MRLPWNFRRDSNAPRRLGAALIAALPALLLAAIALPAAIDPALARERGGRSDNDFEWSFPMTSGKTIEIRGVNGTVQAEYTSGKEVEVSAVKHARRSDPASVRIEVNNTDDGATVCAVYPGAGNDCESGDSWHSHTRNNDVVVDFHVKVPRGVHLDARTVNGNVDVDGLRGHVQANTVNGSISISTSETAEATTVNGSITARVGSSDWDESLQFTTVNGAISVIFPEDVNASVDASSMNGSITSDFPLTVRGKIGRRHLSGRIGHGGGELSMSTVNGSIHLRSSQD